MAFSRDHRTIIQLKNAEINGFADVEGTTIRDCADLIMTPVGDGNALQNAKNISSVYGNIVAWLLNAASKDPGISGETVESLLVLYLCLADAPYKGDRVVYSIHPFDPENPIENKCIADLKRLKVDEEGTGMEKNPGSILQLSIDGHDAAIYYPKWKCFIPGAGFRESPIFRMNPESFMRTHSHTVHRCRAILTNLLEHGADPVVIKKVLDRIGGMVSEKDMAVYRAEPKMPVSGQVAAYIRTTSPDAEPSAVCGYMGTNSSDKLVETPVLIHTGTAPMPNMNRSFQRVSENLVIIPPVRNVNSIYDASYRFGPLDKKGIPAWIDFSAELDGRLYHRIYADTFKTCQPENYIDMAYMVPEGVLTQYNYLVQESAAASLGLDDLQTKWRVYPEDDRNTVVRLSSAQYPAGEWEIYRRSVRIDRMELCDAATGTVLGTVIPEKVPAGKDAKRKMYLSLDPAGAVSVRLKSMEGTNRSDALEYENLIHPMTPMAKAEFDQAIERRMDSPERKGTHFDSLLQRFDPEEKDEWFGLRINGRIWMPDEKALFHALKGSSGVMTEAMGNLGVFSNMKELLTHTDLKDSDRKKIVRAFKNYIGILLLEAVMALAKEGFLVSFGNLEVLISYPKNGSEEGITKEMKDIIQGSVEFVNEYLDVSSQLELGKNVILCSESEAASIWNQMNLFEKNPAYEGKATGTSDYGHSTHDYSLRADGHLYTFSIPYAAQRITNATLAKIYAGNAAALVRCFNGGSQELKREAQQALEKAMESPNGKLHERLGFVLPLIRLFDNCTFKVTGANADSFQMKVQELTEAKLNLAIPAYAYTILQAVKDGALRTTQDVVIAPVGKGSLAMDNTAPGFKKRFTERLYVEINYLIKQDGGFPEGTEYTGKIDFAPNNDKDKKSVAQGMIWIREHGERKAVMVSEEFPAGHYYDFIHGSGEQADDQEKKKFLAELDALSIPSKIEAYNKKKEALYQEAFNHLIDGYTYEQFEAAFERFGYTGIETGIEDIGVLDETVREIVKDQFDNLCAQLKQQGKELIMSCPYVEKELVCGALIDLAIDRMELFSKES